MNYLSAEGITKIYGDKVLFEDLEISINKGQKVALIAKNGTGKSSLLKILASLDSSDNAGKVLIHRDVKMGYLEQDPLANERGKVLDVIYTDKDNPVVQAILYYEAAIVAQELKNDETTQAQLEKCMGKMSLLNAWDYEAKAKQILFQFHVRKLDQDVSELSGGERKRLALARLLIQEPDFLILDEPTNHLDLEMIEWLEEFFSRSQLSLMLVTHDRYFLDRVCNEILELEGGKLQRFRGNYEHYLNAKAEMDLTKQVETEKAKKLFKKELAFVRAQPKARTTKSKARVESVNRLEDKTKQYVQDDVMNFAGIKMARIGGKTLELHHIEKSYDENVILKDFTYTFKRRERVGIVGKNGAGKSTLLNIFTGGEKPDDGKVVVGSTIVYGYYSQQGLKLDDNRKVIDVIRDIAEVLPMEKGKYLTAGQLLDHFQFPYSKHQNYVSTLSGGEKRRLFLLTILMKNPNFLILDEPTNDLDLLTLNILEEYLLHFQGCLVIVSHDRYFMDKLVNHLFVFEGEGKVRDFPGNYSQYRERREIELIEEREQLKNKKAKVEKVEPEQKKINLGKRKLSFNEKREFEKLEKDMEQLEKEKEELGEKLNSGQGSHDEISKWATRMGEIVDLVDEKEMRWLELSEFDM